MRFQLDQLVLQNSEIVLFHSTEILPPLATLQIDYADYFQSMKMCELANTKVWHDENPQPSHGQLMEFRVFSALNLFGENNRFAKLNSRVNFWQSPPLNPALFRTVDFQNKSGSERQRSDVAVNRIRERMVHFIDRRVNV